MLEWKARILSLLIGVGVTFGQFWETLVNNWNW